MNFPFFISRRYLFAKKSQNVINIITSVSIIGVAFGTAGLIVVLSVFNGFGKLVLSLYNDFDPDIKISAVKGKYFNPADADFIDIKNLKQVRAVSFTLEENALLRYNDRQVLGRIKGVDESFVKYSPLRNKIIDGRFFQSSGETNSAVIGSGVAYFLGLNLSDRFTSINIFIPKAGETVSLNPQDAFNESYALPAGVFALQPDFDDKYVLVPLGFIREITEQPVNVSFLEVTLNDNVDADNAKAAIEKICGNGFKIETRSEQHDFLNKILRSEKLVSYFVLILILLIATFTIIGSLTMLIIEKKNDIVILKSLGADLGQIKSIFLNEGLLITFIGTLIGLFLGFAICYAQLTFGIVKLQDAENFIIDAYPVDMMLSDFIITFFIVSLIGSLSSIYAVKNLVK